MTRPIALVALLAIVFIPCFAIASEPSADELIEQGLTLRRSGRTAEALELFQRAHAFSPSPRTFGQMGLAEASLQHWVDADLHLSVSLTTPEDPWVIKNRAFLEQALEMSRRHIGDLIISGPAGAEVFVGAKFVGTLPAVPPVHLAEGPATVSATAAGFKPFDQNVVISPGVRTSVTIALNPIVTEPVAMSTSMGPAGASSLSALGPVPAGLNRRNWHTWAGASLAAAGAGLLTWGIIWIAIDNNDACGSTHGAACGTAYNTKTPGWILAGVGTAAIAGGAAIFFTGRGAASSSVAVGLGPRSLVLQGRF